MVIINAVTEVMLWAREVHLQHDMVGPSSYMGRRMPARPLKDFRGAEKVRCGKDDTSTDHIVVRCTLQQFHNLPAQATMSSMAMADNGTRRNAMGARADENTELECQTSGQDGLRIVRQG